MISRPMHGVIETMIFIKSILSKRGWNSASEFICGIRLGDRL